MIMITNLTTSSANEHDSIHYDGVKSYCAPLAPADVVGDDHVAGSASSGVSGVYSVTGWQLVEGGDHELHECQVCHDSEP